MACTFPTYDLVTAAEILGVIYPRSTIGRFDESLITADNTSEVSIVGEAIAYFNKLAADNSVDYSALSDDKCAKLRMSLRWYIVGKYRQHELEIGGCPECYKDDDLTCEAFAKACMYMKLVNTTISTVASFCTFKTDENGFDGFYGVSSFNPKACLDC